MSLWASRLNPRQDSWLRGLMPFALGVALVSLAGFLLHWVPSQPRLDVYAVAFVAIGAVYVGSALAEKRGRSILLETAISTTCIALTLIGLWVSPLALIAGYILHGIWDFFHHPVHVGAQISWAGIRRCASGLIGAMVKDRP